MKMTIEDYNKLKERIEAFHKEWSPSYKDYELQGLTHMRYRWDIFHASLNNFTFNKHLYTYLNDNHIDTAIKRIVNELEGTNYK